MNKYLLLIFVFFTAVSLNSLCAQTHCDSLKVKIITIPSEGTGYFRLLEKGETCTMRSGRVVLEPGENVGEHSTDNYEELVIILSGSGEMVNESGIRSAVTEGQAVYVPPYSKHNVYNTGTSALVYIYVVSKAKD